MRRLIYLLAICLALAVSPALAAKRVALIIGNNDYTVLPSLNNAAKDAGDMARKLEGLGFEVILNINATRRDMGRAMRAYESKAAASEVGLIFYAGHGIQADGKNYLIPSDANIEIEDDLAYEGVAAEDFLQSMERAGTPVNIMILDACRNNPLPRRSRSAARGLSVVGIPRGAKGTAILYSAGEGQTAADGPVGGNGVFTAALLEVLDTPNLTLEQTIKHVIRRVRAKTNGKQRPWSLTSLDGDFYFNRSAQTPVVTPGLATAPLGKANMEAMFWNSIQNSTDAADFADYVSQFPSGTFTRLAKRRAKELKRQQVASLTPPAQGIEPLDETYVVVKTANVRSAPDGKSAKLTTLGRDTGVQVTGKTADGEWLRIAHGGKDAFVWGSLIKPIGSAELAAWGRVKGSTEASAFEGFLSEYQSSYFSGRARRLLAALAPFPKAVAPSPPAISPPAQAGAPKCRTAKLIVPWKAGGGTHVLLSIFEKTIQAMDVPSKIKVVTVPGQGGNKGAKEAAKAKPDGCTLFAIHQSALTSFFNGRIKFTFPAFDTVAMLTSTPDIIGASGQAPWNNFADFKKAAQAKPGTILVGATFGSTSQFMWLILEDLTGMKFKYVPFDGTRQRMTALLSNAITMGTLNIASGHKYLSGGQLKAYGIADAKRSKYFPDMPTMRELGVDLVFALKRGVVAPKGTPREYINYWSGVFKKATEDKGLLKQMDAKGTDIKWVGPKGYRKWAEQTYKDYEKVAIKIGMYKKR